MSLLSEPATKPYPQDIRQLTSLRFYAAFIIVIFHYFLLLPQTLTGIVAKGYLGVDFFFILSGFILSHVYMPEMENGSFKSADFLIKRLARIYPVHLATLLAFVAVIFGAWALGLSQHPEAYFNTGTFAINLLLLQAFGLIPYYAYNVPSWSISAEWFAYMLFPLLARFALGRKNSRLLLAAAILFFIGAWTLAALAGKPLTEFTFRFGIARIAPEFFLGIALYCFGRKFSPKGISGAVFFLCAILSFVLMHFEVSDVFIVPLFAVLILYASESARQGFGGFLTWRTSVYLGNISYSLYMVHFPLRELIFFSLFKYYGQADAVPAPVFTLWWYGGILLTFPVALICYHFVEAPARRRITTLFFGSDKREKQQAPI